MQTFLPFADFRESARVLDSPRLGKQRVETLQVLRAINLPDYGWASHPAVTMWRGRTPALVLYGLTCVREWTARGHADSTDGLIAEFAPEVAESSQQDLADAGLLPSWLGDERVHLSHRSALLRKDPAWYRSRLPAGEPDNLPYYWPGMDDLPATTEPTGRPLWVVRPDSPAVLARFVSDGIVGLGSGCGIDQDVAGMDEQAMRAALREHAPARRPGKQLRQLVSLVEQVQVGDDVGVPIERDSGLLLGRVLGDYRHFPAADPVHRRAVTWVGRVDRADVDPPAVLQDPRQLFRVRLRPTER